MAARELALSGKRFSPLLLVILFLATGLPSILLAAPTQVYNCQSAAPGDWDQPSTWVNCGSGVPGSADNVTINSGHIVTIPNTAGDITIHDLTIASKGKLTANSGTLTITGDWSGTGAFDHGGGTVRFAGSAAQFINNSRTGTDKRFNHLVIASDVTAKYSIDLVGDLTVTTDASLTVNNTIEFELSNAKVLDCDGSCSFGTLIVRTVDASPSSQPVQVSGNLQIATSSSTFTAPADLRVGGDWLNSGTFVHNSGTVTLNGSAGQSIDATNVFHNLTVSNRAGITLIQSQAIAGALQLSSGLIHLNAYTLTLDTAASISGGPFDTSHMILADSGHLCKAFAAGGSFTFPIGDSSGPDYSPASISLSSGTGTVCATVTDAPHPDNTGSDKLSRYWTLSASGLSGYTATVSFTYTDADVIGSEANLYGVHRVGGQWQILNAVDQANNIFTGTVSSLSDFTAGSSSLPVTLTFFRATRSPSGQLEIHWQTATEVGVLGFHLLAGDGRSLHRLNSDLIPAHGGDSLIPQEYRYDVAAEAGTALYLQEVDVLGRQRLHGPFTLGQSYGRPVAPQPIDWAAINAEHAAQEALRRARWAAATQRSLTAWQAPASRVGLTSRSDRPSRGAPEGAAQSGPTGPAIGQASPATIGRVFLPLVVGHGPSTTPLARFLVRQDGLYRVTYQDLRAAGLDLAQIPASSLALSSQGQPVPIHVSAATFSPGAFLEFYGQALHTLYTDTNVYILSLAPGRARQVQLADGSPPAAAPVPYYRAESTFERNLAYSFAAPNGDPWYDTRLLARSAPISATFPLLADHLVSVSLPTTLTVDLWGGSDWPGIDPDHHVRLLVNGQQVADLTFNGLAAAPVQVTLPAGLLHAGANILTVQLPGDSGVPWDVVMLDHISLAYPRAFYAQADRLRFRAAGQRFTASGFSQPDVVVYRLTDQQVTRLAPVVVTPLAGTYQVSFAGSAEAATYVLAAESALLTPEIVPARPWQDITSGPAEYLIIAHPDFLAGVEPLAQFHRQQGLKVRVVDVEDIYAQFSYGIFDPHAIADYIAYAARHLGTRYVLLVGGDTYDYHDYLGLGSRSFIPSLYAATDPVLVKFAPVDPLFTDLDGDQVPDLPIGRLPVRTEAELELLVSKTLAYSRKTYPETAVFAADAASAGLSFRDVSDALVRQLPSSWTVTQAYLDTLGLAETRRRLLDQINRGVALTGFFGHSGPTHWSFQNLFTAADAQALTNAGRPTVVTQWGCWNTYYPTPEYNTLAHELLLAGDRGAVVVLGAATLTSAASDAALGVRVIPELTRSGVTIGDAMQAAKADLARTSPYLSDVLLGWTLLGDPALSVTS